MSRPEGMDPADWTNGSRITEMLRGAGHDVTVTDVVATPVGTGQMGASFRLRLTIEGDEGGLPSTMVGKAATGPPERRAISSGSYRTEVDFYRNIAPRIDARIPRCWASWVTDDATDFLLLLEDLAPREQGDQLLGTSVDDAALAAVNLAGLHGPLWNDPWIAGHLPPFDDEQAAGLDAVFPTMVDFFLGRYGPRLEPSTRALYERIKGVTGQWLNGRRTPFAAVHGDYRLDNLMFAPDRSDVAVVDWQTVSLGLPARDLAFLCGTGLSVEDRRAADDDLVATYHATLTGYGVENYSLAECREDYAYGMLQGPLVIVFGSAIAEATERGDEMFTVMAERSAAAMDDLGTLDLLA